MRNLHLTFALCSASQMLDKILWPSQNIWTLSDKGFPLPEQTWFGNERQLILITINKRYRYCIYLNSIPILPLNTFLPWIVFPPYFSKSVNKNIWLFWNFEILWPKKVYKSNSKETYLSLYFFLIVTDYY